MAAPPPAAGAPAAAPTAPAAPGQAQLPQQGTAGYLGTVYPASAPAASAYPYPYPYPYPPPGGYPGYPPAPGTAPPAPGAPPAAPGAAAAPPAQGGYPYPYPYPYPYQYPGYPPAPGAPGAPGAPPAQYPGYPPAPGAYPGYPPAPGAYPGYPPAAAAGGYTYPHGQAPWTPTPGFNPNTDAETIHYAIKGLTTDHSKLIFLVKRTPDELKAIVQAYRQKFNQDMQRQIYENCTTQTDLRALLDDVFHSKLTLDVRGLQRTFDKVGKADSDLITEILITCTNKERGEIRAAFHKESGTTLEKRIADGFSGSIQAFLLKLCADREDTTTVDESKAINDAKALYKAGEGKIGTDDAVFINLFGRCSWAHLKAVSTQYTQVNKKHHTLDQAIDGEFSGAIFRSLRMVHLYATYGRLEFYSDYVYRAMKGLGTNDTILRRVLVLYRHPYDMSQLKVQFKKKHEKSLKEWVYDETSGAYRDALLDIVGET